MARSREFRVVVGTDGSADGRAAVAATIAFPWPARATAEVVVARSLPPIAGEWSTLMWAEVSKRFDRVAAEAQAELRKRWPDAEVVVVDKPPVEAILAAARGARAIAVGTRGHGALGRLVLGSVSRGVVRRSSCSTLVVKGRPRTIHHLLVGLDGSPNARQALEFVAHLRPPRAGRVTLVRVLEPVRAGAIGRLPGGVRGALGRELAALEKEHVLTAQRDLATAAAVLRRAGWHVRSTIRWGIPVQELVAAANTAGAHVLVVGARGTAGVKRLLLGSVAEGVLSASRGPVLIVR
jgi:nucleotide-binding universal stress UspA family protein